MCRRYGPRRLYLGESIEYNRAMTLSITAAAAQQTDPATLREALHRWYGFDDFRPGQEEVIDTVLSGRDTLALMPTGAGKSLCYQLPAMLLPGITLIISPLIGLM